MDPNVIITGIICGTILLTALVSGLTTIFVARYVCRACEIVYHDSKLPLPSVNSK